MFQALDKNIGMWKHSGQQSQQRMSVYGATGTDAHYRCPVSIASETKTQPMRLLLRGCFMVSLRLLSLQHGPSNQCAYVSRISQNDNLLNTAGLSNLTWQEHILRFWVSGLAAWMNVVPQVQSSAGRVDSLHSQECKVLRPQPFSGNVTIVGFFSTKKLLFRKRFTTQMT